METPGQKKWSFNGLSSPKAVVAAAWLSVYAMIPMFFTAFVIAVAQGWSTSGILFGYSLVAGTITLASAIKLKSYHLILVSVILYFLYPIVVIVNGVNS